MSKSITKTLFKLLLGFLSLIILLCAILPLIWPISDLDGLVPAKSLAKAESKFINIPFAGTDGLEIHYTDTQNNDTDQAQTFVLMHGSIFNSFTWNKVDSYFAKNGRVIAYDQVPYGLSEKPLPGDWSADNPHTADAAIEQLFTLLDSLNIEKAILVGNSYGGTLALQAALENPERIEGLILIDAAAYINETVPKWIIDLPQIQRMGPIFARSIGSSEDFIRQTYLDPSKIDDERMALTTLHSRAENWDIAFWQYLSAWSTTPATYIAKIPEIQQPALVVTGDSDTVVPVSDSERLAAELPKAQLKILKNCGHVPQEECPGALKEVIDDWLSEMR